MINGDIKEFIDKLYCGEELWLEYEGKEYFLQGWVKNGMSTIVLDDMGQKPFQKYVWQCTKHTMRECAETFLNSEIWNGKPFMQIQKNAVWKD